MELFTKATKDLIGNHLININSLLILNIDAYLCGGYCSYKENIMEQVEGIESIFAGASIDYSVAPNLHDKVQVLKDIIKLENEEDNEKEVIELALDYIEDSVTIKLEKCKTKLFSNDYFTLRPAIMGYVSENPDNDWTSILERLETLGFNIGEYKAITERGVELVNLYVTNALKSPKPNLKELKRIMYDNKTTSDIICNEELSIVTNKLAFKILSESDFEVLD